MAEQTQSPRPPRPTLPLHVTAPHGKPTLTAKTARAFLRDHLPHTVAAPHGQPALDQKTARELLRTRLAHLPLAPSASAKK